MVVCIYDDQCWQSPSKPNGLLWTKERSAERMHNVSVKHTYRKYLAKETHGGGLKLIGDVCTQPALALCDLDLQCSLGCCYHGPTSNKEKKDGLKCSILDKNFIFSDIYINGGIDTNN